MTGEKALAGPARAADQQHPMGSPGGEQPGKSSAHRLAVGRFPFEGGWVRGPLGDGRRHGRGSAVDPGDHCREVVGRVEAVIALEVKRDALRVGGIEGNDARYRIDPGHVVEALGDNAGFGRCAETGARDVCSLVAAEPARAGDDEHFLRLRLSLAPRGPAVVRAAWMRLEEKLVEHDLDPRSAQLLAQRTETPAVRVVFMPVTEEDCRHAAETASGSVPGKPAESGEG